MESIQIKVEPLDEIVQQECKIEMYEMDDNTFDWDYGSCSSEDDDDTINMEDPDDYTMDDIWKEAHPEDEITLFEYTRGPAGPKTSDIDKNMTPFQIFQLMFGNGLRLLVDGTNTYKQTLQDQPKKRFKPKSDTTLQDMYLYLAILIQMGHDHRDVFKDYWSKLPQFFTPFYSNTLARDRFINVHRFLHFDRKCGSNDERSDRLWKIRPLFDLLKENFARYYTPEEYVSMDQVIVSCKPKVVCKRNNILRKRGRVGIKIFKLCDSAGYTFDMFVNLKQNERSTNESMKMSYTIVDTLSSRLHGFGHKLFIGSLICSPAILDYLKIHQINCCAPFRPNAPGLPINFHHNKLNMKRGDLRIRTRHDLVAICFKEKRDMYLLSNMHVLPPETNYIVRGNVKKPQIVEDYYKHVGYVEMNERMINAHTVGSRSVEWIKNVFFYLLDMTIVNCVILLRSCGSNINHRDFRLTLVTQLIEIARAESAGPSSTYAPTGTFDINRLEIKNNRHWVVRSDGKKRRCKICSARGKRKETIFVCSHCQVFLCVDKCFIDFHTKKNFRA